MARTKEVTIKGVKFVFQSMSPRAYYQLNDACGHGEGRNATKFIDGILRNCVISPPEVKAQGLDYFDEQDDIDFATEVYTEAHSFLKDPVERGGSPPKGEKQ